MTEALGDGPKVAVLMTSYNNVAYVTEQLESIRAQTYENWHLTVSDDGSTDGSLDAIRAFKAYNPSRVDIVRGPGQGSYANHLSMAAKADKNTDYYVFCDSDDVWLPDRLERVVKAMKTFGQSAPVLYGCRLAIIDDKGRNVGLYPRLNRLPASFGNALVQVVAGGPAIAFNKPALDLIALGTQCRKASSKWATHDWWCCLIVSGAGGHVIYDATPTVLYRQHLGNKTGANIGVAAKVSRLRAVARGAFHEKMDVFLPMLQENASRLTPENLARLMAMVSLHRGDGGPIRRLVKLREAGLCRQSRFQSAFLYVMAALNWF